jgi:hypothetical protein
MPRIVTDSGGSAPAGDTKTNSAFRSCRFSTTPTTDHVRSASVSCPPTRSRMRAATSSVTAASPAAAGYRPDTRRSIVAPYGPCGS